jgi:hypothetical protein
MTAKAPPCPLLAPEAAKAYTCAMPRLGGFALGAIIFAAFLGALIGAGGAIFLMLKVPSATVKSGTNVGALDRRAEILYSGVSALNAEIGSLRDLIVQERQDRLTAEARERAR